MNLKKANKAKRFLIISLLLNIILLGCIFLILIQINDKSYNYFKPFMNGNIVMYGNSLTAGSKWHKVQRTHNIINSGTNGHTTTHMLWFLERNVIHYHPRYCFIMGGINDITTGIPMQTTKNNYSRIIDQLLLNNITPIIQSTLFTDQPDSSFANTSVENLNTFLVDLANKHDLLFLDLNKKLSENNSLKAEYTTDGLHLNDAAYDVWMKDLEKILIKISNDDLNEGSYE